MTDLRPFATKRVRAPRSKPGELVVRYANTRSDGPDIYFSWGTGCRSGDGSLANSVFCAPRLRHSFPGEPGATTFDKSFLDELIARGYDPTTLRFSIRKAVPK